MNRQLAQPREAHAAQMSTAQKNEAPIFFGSETPSDVKVLFGNAYYLPAHKYQLAMRSPWFSRAFTGDFPVATGAEIDLGNDESPCLIYAMLRHLYNLPYDQHLFEPKEEFSAKDIRKGSSLVFHLEMYILADKYDVPSLRKVAASAFLRRMSTFLKFPIYIDALQRLFDVVLADRSLQEEVICFISGNVFALTVLNKEFGAKLFGFELFDVDVTRRLLEKIVAKCGYGRPTTIGQNH